MKTINYKLVKMLLIITLTEDILKSLKNFSLILQKILYFKLHLFYLVLLITQDSN